MGHQERQATITVLRTAAEEGRLTPEELPQRISTALGARTFADLDALVADLPVAPPSTELRRAATFDVSRIGADPDHRLRMSGGMSSHVQRGVWSVPPFLALSAGMGSVKLDFQQAVCAHEVVDIAVSGGVGSIVLVVPRGWGANTDRVDRWMGSVSNRIDAIAGPGSPTLVLHGSSAVGSIIVRNPNWVDRRRVSRALRRALSTTRAGGPLTGIGPASHPPITAQPGSSSPQGATAQAATPQDASPQDAPPER